MSETDSNAGQDPVARDVAYRNFLAPGNTFRFGNTIRAVHNMLSKLIDHARTAVAVEVSDVVSEQLIVTEVQLQDLDTELDELFRSNDIDGTNDFDIMKLTKYKQVLLSRMRKLNATITFGGGRAYEVLADALQTVLIPGFEDAVSMGSRPLSSDEARGLLSQLQRECSYSGTNITASDEDDFDMDQFANTALKTTTPIVDLSKDEDKRILNNYGTLLREAVQLFTVGGKTNLVSVEQFLVEGASSVSYLSFEIESMNALSKVDLNPIATWGLFKREFSGTAIRIYQRWAQTMIPVSGAILLKILLDSTSKPAITTLDYFSHTVNIPVLKERDYNSPDDIERVKLSIKGLKKMRSDDDSFYELNQAVKDLIIRKKDVVEEGDDNEDEVDEDGN